MALSLAVVAPARRATRAAIARRVMNILTELEVTTEEVTTGRARITA
jgi:hypothetical protein